MQLLVRALAAEPEAELEELEVDRAEALAAARAKIRSLGKCSQSAS
jgi:hypothetical protein